MTTVQAWKSTILLKLLNDKVKEKINLKRRNDFSVLLTATQKRRNECVFPVCVCVHTSHISSGPSWRPWLHCPTGTCRRPYGSGKTASCLWTPGARRTLKKQIYMVFTSFSLKDLSTAGIAYSLERNMNYQDRTGRVCRCLPEKNPRLWRREICIQRQTQMEVQATLIFPVRPRLDILAL